MQNEPPIEHCRNCGHPLPEAANYCPQCSQRNHDGRFGFREIVAETIGTLFNLDNRLFNTLGALIFPGKLTTDYFQGRHVRYYHPLRLFMFMGLALISILTIRYRQGDSYAKMESVSEDIERNHHRQQFNEELDSVRLAMQPELTSLVARQAIDTFCYHANVLQDTLEQDSTGFNVNVFDGELKGVKVATKDLMELSTDSIISKYQIEGFWNRMLITRSVRMMRGTNEFLLSMLGNAIWIMLVMMPLLALILKLLYFRKPYHYYEHLIFSLHVHSAEFALLFLLMLWKDMPDWAWGVGAVVAVIYPLLALFRVYRQGFVKTLLKFIFLNGAYFILAIFSFIFLAMVSFALF